MDIGTTCARMSKVVVESTGIASLSAIKLGNGVQMREERATPKEGASYTKG